MTKKAAKTQTQAQTQTTEGATEPAKKSNHVQRILEQRKKDAKIDPLLESQFGAGRLYAAISSRPGQSGRSDGYILEGKELEVNVSALWPHDHCVDVGSVLHQENSNREAETCARCMSTLSFVGDFYRKRWHGLYVVRRASIVMRA